MTITSLDPAVDPLPWLLEIDPDNPSVRYFALTDLLAQPPDDEEVQRRPRSHHGGGPVPAILDAQDDRRLLVKAGGGYSPKYRGTVWQIQFLAELGADPADRARAPRLWICSRTRNPAPARSPPHKVPTPGARSIA